jgi:hypothetical protein
MDQVRALQCFGDPLALAIAPLCAIWFSTAAAKMTPTAQFSTLCMV